MKKINYIIIITLIILNTILAYKIKSNTNEFTAIYSLLNKKLDKNKSATIKFEHNFIREQENENLHLDSNFEVLDIAGNKVLAKDIFKKNSLVFRFSELNCEECIDAEINALVNNRDKIKDVILIGYYQNPRDLFVFYKEFQKKGLINFDMYLSPSKGLGIPLDRQNTPYYFCVNSSLIMTNFFIPQKEKPNLSKVYLDYTFKNLVN